MAVPRPVLLALIGVALLSATFLATRNARDHANGSSNAPAAKQSSASGTKQQSVVQAPKPTVKTTPQPKAARPSAQPKALAAKAAAVERAIDRKRVVVLALFQRGADDRATARAVASLRHHAKGVAVFTDKIDHVARYGPIVSALGVSQAPAVVIVDRGRRAHLIEGYIDAQTLAQEVADVRR